MAFVPQPEAALAAARAAIPRDARLGRSGGSARCMSITTLTGSALIALAVLHGRLSIEEAWAAAHVDEDWNMELWGRDELALERRAFRFAEMQAAARCSTRCADSYSGRSRKAASPNPYSRSVAMASGPAHRAIPE